MAAYRPDDYTRARWSRADFAFLALVILELVAIFLLAYLNTNGGL